MSTVINVNVNVDLSEDTKNFFKGLLSTLTTATTAAVSAPASTASATKPVASTAPAAPATKPAAPVVSKVETAPAATTTATTAAAATIGIEQVREVLKNKVNMHREAIKAKLDELGAPSVTKLDPSLYTELYNFLQGLA